MEEVICLCGCRIKSRIYDSKKVQGMNIVQCHNCNLMYLNPRYTKQELYSILYKNYVGSMFFKKVEDEKLRFKEREDDARYEMNLIQKALGNNKGLKIYDVGISGGIFLKIARDEFDADIYGNDISDISIKLAKEKYNMNNVQFGDLPDLQLRGDFFDAVVMWNTLEHTSNPVIQLAKAKAILKTGGILIIEVPTTNLNVPWEELDESPYHLYYFNFEVLKIILESIGFEIIWHKEYIKDKKYATLDLVAKKK